ncbi:MAG: chemotaxis protein CheD [ANME-2 cluster archaeon]|nr:chemotaxis protein CheD [ANME-2 cluster archaeon]MDF1557153.1 chemotaxis protein CheD [ANME-2 cluster archaeon]
MAYRRVNMAEMVISSDNDVLAIHGLGSCLGLTIYDKSEGIGGMSHIMLPCNLANRPNVKPGKFVDSAIDEMVRELEKLGCNKKNLVAKICGGSMMFQTSKDSENCIGTKNIVQSKKLLKEKGIPLLAEDVGGNYGRIVEFDVKSGRMIIRTVHGESKVI